MRTTQHEKRYLNAFGEIKSLSRWARDERSPVRYDSLRNRVVVDGMEIENALLMPKDRRRNNIHTVFGETKTIAEWSLDKRCVVPYGCLHNRIYRFDWSMEEALITPVQESEKFDAFEENKSIYGWAGDERAKVGYQGIRYRIEKRKMSMEEAIITPPMGFLRKRREGQLHSLHGEEKTLMEWSRDRRCKVTLQVLNRRMLYDWNLEEAMTKKVNNLGRKKSLKQWLKEEKRSGASLDDIKSRIKLALENI